MKIHELAQKTGLTAPTIRFYEKEGLLDTRHVRRGENNYRDYCEEAVEHLLMIKTIQTAGFTLAELKKLVEGEKVNEFPLYKKIESIRKKMREIERKKAELELVQTYLARMLAHKMALMDEKEKEEKGGCARGSCIVVGEVGGIVMSEAGNMRKAGNMSEAGNMRKRAI